MKFLSFAVLLVSAFAAPHNEMPVEIEKAQMPYYPMDMYGYMNMNQMMMDSMYSMGMGGMMQPQVGFGQSNFGGYGVDYSSGCSNSCDCAQMCVPWIPCQCRCPPPCPPPRPPPCQQSCHCQHCAIWWQCQPCGCNNPCSTPAPSAPVRVTRTLAQTQTKAWKVEDIKVDDKLVEEKPVKVENEEEKKKKLEE